tara:strand:+ start:183 stop:530 length:348 start_codon:yes stop_codon:yes gene_type:complete
MKPDKLNLGDILKIMSARIAHLEDATLDNRDLLVKLAKQGNQIVNFLKEVEIETEIEESNIDNLLSNSLKEDENGFKKYQKILEQLLDKQEELKEFEEELEKHKDKLTPGQCGES